MSEDQETQGITGAIALCLIAIVLFMTGCASKPTPVTMIASPISDCAKAINGIATSTAGDPTSKVVAVSAIERLCGNQAQVAQQAPASLGTVLWNAALQTADIVLRGYGIKTQRDVSIVQSNNAAATSIASYQSFSNIASSGFSSNASIASNIQAPAPNITLSGTGVIGSGQYNFTAPVTTTTTTNPSPRVCTATATGLACVGG